MSSTQLTRADARVGDVLTTEQVADYLQLSPHTLVLWRRNGEPKLPFVRCGRRIRYLKTDLDSFLHENRETLNGGE